MRFFSRSPEPEFLSQHAARWNQQWVALRQLNPGASFNWYTYNNTPVNQLLGPYLEGQTQKHCSYCDAFPLGPASRTIDHFKPKSRPEFAQEAYTWNNLFWACADCQKNKGEQFNLLMIAPDEATYSFEKCFLYNFHSHEIEINPAASDQDQQRALVTRDDIFNFNEPAKIAARRMAYERWFSTRTEQILDDFPFRFIFDLMV